MSLINMDLLATDGCYGGDYAQVDVDENSVGKGALLSYTNADGNYDMANASASATPEVNHLVIALETGTGSDKLVMMRGYIRKGSWNWTPGKDLYVSTTNGLLTQTAPSGSSQFVKKVGYAVTADIICFDPTGTPLIELEA